ncbi:hypothetical protein BDR26DRAFT_873832 [Obelidium mucronatum]|nr:hypothetical protein BDR26DRAFT_873832 [Obelidium mucronatum]
MKPETKKQASEVTPSPVQAAIKMSPDTRNRDMTLADVMHSVSPSDDPPQKVLAKLIEDNPDPTSKPADRVKLASMAVSATVGLVPVIGEIAEKVVGTVLDAYKEQLDANRVAANTIRFSASRLAELANEKWVGSPTQLEALESYKAIKSLTERAGTLVEQIRAQLDKSEKVFLLGEMTKELQAANLDEVRKDLKELNGVMETIASHGERLNKLEQAVEVLEEKAEQHQQQIDTLHQRDETQDHQIESLEGQVDALQATQEQQIASQQQQINTQQEQIASKDRQIETQGQQIADQSQQITAKDQQIEAQGQQIEAQGQQIAAQNQQIAAKDQQIAAQQKQIDALFAIAANKEQVAEEKEAKKEINPNQPKMDVFQVAFALAASVLAVFSIFSSQSTKQLHENESKGNDKNADVSQDIDT